jgi:hypothetical protein
VQFDRTEHTINPRPFSERNKQVENMMCINKGPPSPENVPPHVPKPFVSHAIADMELHSWSSPITRRGTEVSNSSKESDRCFIVVASPFRRAIVVVAVVCCICRMLTVIGPSLWQQLNGFSSWCITFVFLWMDLI